MEKRKKLHAKERFKISLFRSKKKDLKNEVKGTLKIGAHDNFYSGTFSFVMFSLMYSQLCFLLLSYPSFLLYRN